jgi:hypothetical protein
MIFYTEGNQQTPLPQPQLPEYGQRIEPDYGGMESQYPGWNPYVYGAPDPEPEPEPANSATAGTSANAQSAPYSQGNANPFGANTQYSQPGQARPADHQTNNSTNNLRNSNNFFFQGQPINLDDPKQNPVYGRTDFFAIIGFFLSLLGFWFLGLPLCIISFRRIPVMHMRGRGWALAGIIIAIIQIVIGLAMLFGGFSPTDLLGSLTDISGGTGAPSGPTVNA